MTDFQPLYCLHCRRQLAVASPTRVVFNEGAYTEEPLAIRCNSCGARRYWSPQKKVVDVTAVIVYSERVPA